MDAVTYFLFPTHKHNTSNMVAKGGNKMEYSTDKCFTIQQVEKILGIPRTKIRHYLNKDLIIVEKNEQSGYYSYSFSDLIRLAQIVYYREILDLSVDTVEKLLQTTNIEIIEDILTCQAKKAKKSIKKKEDQLNYLEFNQQMINHVHKFRNKISLVPFETFYVFPYSCYFDTNLSVYPVLYGAAEFSFDGENIKREKRCCIVFEKDLKYLNDDSVYEVCTNENAFNRDLSVYTVSLTEKDIDDPSLLLPMIQWSAKHRFRVNNPIYLVHFFPFYKGEHSYKYVEAYLPIDVL